jgi:predicted SAM-dependent methyltransferase
MKYLNLGCGSRFHTDWTNINFVSTSESVIAHDLSQGIPFPDASFDVVYHSHVLEHFPQSAAASFIKECYRVLRPQGILRVVIPDLEQIARTYLYALEQAVNGSKEWEQNYQWVLLEMYDQTVRDRPGGKMLEFLSNKDIANPDFAIERCGVEIKNIILAARQDNTSQMSVVEPSFKKILKHIYRFFRYAEYRHQSIIKFMLRPQELNALELGQFRQSGEIHQWMYDRYSLSLLLKSCGLEEIAKKSANESSIPNWASFNLDTEADGSIYKPDSIYMEARKPVT